MAANTKRCLLVGCSKTKVPSSAPLAAIERYDGPTFRLIRRYLRTNQNEADTLDVLILSAEFGLISSDLSIPYYDRRMTVARAKELHPQVLDALKERLAHRHYTELFISLGADYRAAIKGFEALVPPETKVIQASGGLGVKAGHLKRWLYGTELSIEVRHI